MIDAHHFLCTERAPGMSRKCWCGPDEENRKDKRWPSNKFAIAQHLARRNRRRVAEYCLGALGAPPDREAAGGGGLRKAMALPPGASQSGEPLLRSKCYRIHSGRRPRTRLGRSHKTSDSTPAVNISRFLVGHSVVSVLDILIMNTTTHIADEGNAIQNGITINQRT